MDRLQVIAELEKGAAELHEGVSTRRLHQIVRHICETLIAGLKGETDTAQTESPLDVIVPNEEGATAESPAMDNLRK